MPYASFRRGMVGALIVSFAAAVPATAADPMDWPYWRGPEQNGVSREKNLIDKWSPDGTNLLWKDETAGGRSTPIVMNGKLYTIVRHLPDTKNEGEKVLCLDAATGKKLWEHVVQVYLTDVPTERSGWSSVVGDPATGRVYALSVCGLFVCLEGDTGKLVWSHSMSEEFGLLSTYGGRTNFPIVFEDLVIISGVMIGWGDNARPNHRFIAFDKATGKSVWFNATRPLPDDTTYSAPVIQVVNGRWQMIVGAGDGFLYSFQPRTGELIWKYSLSRRGVNNTPLVVGDMIYASQSEENPGETSMGALIALSGTGTGDMTQSATWKNKGAMIGRASPLLIDGKLFTVDDGAGLFSWDLATGKQLFMKKFGTAQRASPLYADGKIYTIDMNGRWYILEPQKDGKVKELHRLRLKGEGCSTPIVSHGRLYIQTLECLYCAGKKGVEPSADPIPAGPKETPVGDNTEAVKIQVVPCESLVKPGEKVTLEARLYNSLGQLLEKKPVEFECKANGTVDASGVFTAGDKGHTAAKVIAKIGSLVGEANIRIIPDFPWSFDFSDKEIPLSWIGMRYRHVIRPIDGNPTMVKITTIPKGQRSQAWIGRTDSHDYTVQADVRGARTNEKLPDIGLIAQRYTLDMMGQAQNLQIRTWTASTRRAMANKPFQWKEGVWYTLKFRAANEGGKAVLRGKVWKRDEAEPSDWSIELIDEAPNTTGSPGFFGNAQNAEIFIDNVKVTANG